MRTTAARIVLAIPDLQIPFEHPDALKFCKAVRKKYQCDTIVNLGDELDQYALSNYIKDPDAMSAGDEASEAVRRLQPWYKAFPEMKICKSNHMIRVYCQAQKAGIPKMWLKSYREALQAPEGWLWEDRWVIDGIVYEHGDAQMGGNGRLAAYQLPFLNTQSTVFGHFHTNGCIQWITTSRFHFFGFNVGCLIDELAYAFEYSRKNKLRPTLGCGVIKYGLPIFVPMILNRNRRWNGVIV